MITLTKWIIVASSITVSSLAFASVTVKMNFTAEKGVGPSTGTVVISETPKGLIFTPHLQGLTPGVHGFHIHEKASCDTSGMAAGGHLDPEHTGKHLGPYNDKGHLGDLPILVVKSDGTATTPVVAPKLHSLKTIRKHALMVHHSGDNYSDTPEKLGGGGVRMVCGIIP